MTAMLYSGQKSVTGKTTHEAHGEVVQPRGPGAAEPLDRWTAGPLGRWAAGPLGRYRPFASKEMSGPAECTERLNDNYRREGSKR